MNQVNFLARYNLQAGFNRLVKPSKFKLGMIPAAGIMRTLQVGNRPTQLALAIAEFGRIDPSFSY